MSHPVIENENDIALSDSMASQTQDVPKRSTCLRLCLVLLCWAVTLLLIVGWKSIFILDSYTLGFALILLAIMLIPQFVFPRKRRYQLALFLVFVLAGIASMMFLMPPVWVGPETTYISSPLKANGSVDYFKAVKAKCDCNCDPKDNGISQLAASAGKPLLLRLHYGITGQETSDDAHLLFVQVANRYWIELCDELNLDPELKATLTYEPPRDYYLGVQDKRQETATPAKDEKTESQTKTKSQTKTENQAKAHVQKGQPSYPHQVVSNRYNVLLTKPWTAKSEPDMEQWLKENKPMLDLFSQAVRKPEFFVPMIRLDEEQPLAYVPSFTASVMRPLAEGLRIRMTHALGNKDADAAWSNWNDLCRMASHLLPHSRSGADTLALMSEPLEATVPLIDAKLLKPETLRQMLDVIDKIPHELNLKDSVYRERLETLDGYMAIISGSGKLWRQIDRTGQVGARDQFTRFRSRLARTVPLSKPLDRINNAYDELDKAIETGQWPDWPQKRMVPFRLTPMGHVNTFLRAGVWHLFPMMIADSQLWSLEFSDASPMMLTRWKKLLARKEMCKVAAAIEIYRIDHKVLPKSLDELKDILGTIPADPFASGKPFVYRLDDKVPAGYMLYSIGTNQRDDNGVPLNESKPQADDIPLR